MSISGKSTASPVFLLVDDDPDICSGIRANMEDKGVDFDEAYKGEEAIALVKKGIRGRT